MPAPIRSSAVPSAAAAAQAEPPPGVGDGEPNAASTSRNGRSAYVCATNQFSHRISADAVDRNSFPATSFAADDAHGVPCNTERVSNVTDERLVCSAVDWSRCESDEQRVAAFAIECGPLCAWNHTHVELDAC